MGISIVIPSHRRAGRVPALKAVTGAILCVPQSQEADYRRCHPDTPILCHPDTILGLALKRQWIYERFGDVFMLYDDVDSFSRLYFPAGRPGSRMTPEDARAIIETTAVTCRSFGAYLFGFNVTKDARTYCPQMPFRLTGYVNGCAIGLLAGSKIYFHRDSIAVEDFFACGVNAYHHRYLFVDQRFAARQQDTFKNAGGQALYRTQQTEEKDYQFLRRMFGEVVQRKTASRRFGQRQRAVSRAARQLLIPF